MAAILGRGNARDCTGQIMIRPSFCKDYVCAPHSRFYSGGMFPHPQFLARFRPPCRHPRRSFNLT